MSTKGIRQATCKKGHDLTDPDNIYVRRDGTGRECLFCRRERARVAAKVVRDKEAMRLAVKRAYERSTRTVKCKGCDSVFRPNNKNSNFHSIECAISFHLKSPALVEFESIDLWREAASCRNKAPMFDLNVEGEQPDERVKRLDAARKICRDCPVILQCAREQQITGGAGVWAGKLINSGKYWIGKNYGHRSRSHPGVAD